MPLCLAFCKQRKGKQRKSIEDSKSVERNEHMACQKAFSQVENFTGQLTGC